MAFAWIMAIEGGKGKSDPSRFSMSGGIIGDKVGLGKTLSVVLPMICMDQGHKDRIILVVVITTAKS